MVFRSGLNLVTKGGPGFPAGVFLSRRFALPTPRKKSHYQHPGVAIGFNRDKIVQFVKYFS
jgi:hypothetical protein